jgi:O-antigen/teichoic acid export membrane protein
MHISAMSGMSDSLQASRKARFRDFLAARGGLLKDYFSAISGSAGRLVFSLVYFVALANALSIPEFGLFATASAAGVMLSRILGFGFVSSVYRIAAVRPRLIGIFTAGFLLLSLLSLPVLAIAAAATYALFFASSMGVTLFAIVIAAEALLWRPAELVIIVNNGMGRFGRAALLTIVGTAVRAAAAVAFIALPSPGLAEWSWIYLAANAVSLAIGVVFFYPRQALVLKPKLYFKRLPDALYVAGAEMLFYLQMELDKLLVLSIGGAKLAGIYAIIMRLVDLTAIPIRAFSMMLVQKLMRAPQILARWRMRVGIEGAVFVVSTLALLALAILLRFFPYALGRNVAQATPLVMLALFVPGLRNLVEYQAELLFGRGQMLIRAFNLALLALAKGLLLTWMLATVSDTADLVWSLNWLFAALYLVSALATYGALRLPAKAV